MSVQRLSDNRAMRAMTVEQADAMFREIALLTVRINKIKNRIICPKICVMV